jgi:ectoine hydroxylase-related dioxygenase (phytanoyl-CoA dioxygenase family)
MSSQHAENVDRDGYTVVLGALTEDEVAETREFLTELVEKKPQFDGDEQYPARPGSRGGGVRHDVFSRYPETRRVLDKPEVLDMLRSALGEDFVLLPEMALHDSRYGGWHKDTTPLESAGYDFHWEPGFRLLECGIYFQDNDEFGGGLDIVPGSHREPDDSPPPPKVTFMRRLRGKLSQMGVLPPPKDPPTAEEPRRFSIPNKARDLVAFDLRAKHMATQPSPGIEEIPADKRKFALLFIAGANNEHSRRYRDLIAGQYKHLQGDQPTYPDELVEVASRQSLTLI